jgi:hypothetical protein
LVAPDPPVRAPGVVYTPPALARLLVDVALAPHRGEPDLRLLDPACGDGRLLVAAAEHLGAPGLDRAALVRRQLFGVDRDPAAVHAARGSLAAWAGAPDLDLRANIVLGDALIGPGFAGGPLDPPVRPLDWAEAFAFAGHPDPDPGRFDVVLGNPPYFSIDEVWGRGDPRCAHLKAAFPEVYRDKSDVLFYFFAQALRLARRSVTVLVSRSFLRAHKADRLRAHLAPHVVEVIDFGARPVFSGVGIQAALVRLEVRPGSSTVTVRRPDPADPLDRGPARRVARASLGAPPWSLSGPAARAVAARIDAAGPPLGEVLFVGKGMETGRNAVFGGLSAAQVAAWGLPPALARRRARGRDLSAFHLHATDHFLLYTPGASSWSDLPAAARDHLSAHRAALEARAPVRRGDRPWWRFSWPLHHARIDRPRILCPALARSHRFCLAPPGDPIGLTDTTALFDRGQPEDLRYLLGLLNAPLMVWRHGQRAKRKGGGVREFYWNALSQLPIRRIDAADPAARRHHDAVVDAVDALQAARGADPAASQALHHAVCALYGVDPGEIDDRLASDGPARTG